MEENPNPYPQAADEAGGELYLARLAEVPARLVVDDEEIESVFDGEVLFAGRFEEDALNLTALRYISLWSAEIEALKGPLTIAGPVAPRPFHPSPATEIPDLDLRLYYRPLSELEPTLVESDAYHPPLEVLRARLAWEPGPQYDEVTPVLNLTLSSIHLHQTYLGLVEQVEIGPVELPLLPVVPRAEPGPAYNSLGTCGGSPPLPPGCGPAHTQRALRVRFISLSAIESPASLESLAQAQIDGACAVWWLKGGIKIAPASPDVIADPALGGVVNYGQEASLETHVTSEASDAVEVYLVDSLVGRQGGGVTLNSGTHDAYVILEIAKAQHNRYLLAHELGHVLGLSHPDSGGAYPGSECSVMVPDRPCSPRNTELNLTAASLFPLGDVFTTIYGADGLPQGCCWAYDAEQGYFHLVRDFPADDGTQPSTPAPPASAWWTHSDVWNADQGPMMGQNEAEQYEDGSPLFNPDHSPRHSQPRNSGTNTMLVRVHTCQALNQPVDVYLFLAVPGAASEPLHPLNGGAPLTFPFFGTGALAPAVPRTQAVAWSVPGGYPAHCCVFAVARSADDLDAGLEAILANPAAHNFYDLWARLKTDNDVAQRNLNIQMVASAPGAGIRTTLSWIGLTNPLGLPMPLSLEVDVHDPELLTDLEMTLDGVHRLKVQLEPRSQRLPLYREIEPGKFHSLRLRAGLAAGLDIGQELPIDIRLFAGEEPVTGYRHLLRVAPIHEVAAQVLDELYGALRDVRIACGSAGAGLLGERILENAAALHAGRGDAFADLKELTLSVQTLAIGLAHEGEELCEQVGHLLLELSGLLAGQEPGISTARFLELVRDLACRIQEPAGRAARRIL